MAKQAAHTVGRMIVVKRQLGGLTSVESGLRLFACSTDPTLSVQQPLVVNRISSRTVTHPMIVTSTPTFCTVSICMATGLRINMAVNALRSFGQRVWNVTHFPLFAAPRIQYVAPFLITTPLRFLEATFAMAVLPLANFCDQMFFAPTSRRIGAIPTARGRSHEWEYTHTFTMCAIEGVG
jgi:hypothetical protein